MEYLEKVVAYEDDIFYDLAEDEAYEKTAALSQSQKARLTETGIGALGGAIIGGIGGAVKGTEEYDENTNKIKKNHLRGALRGALGGAAIGGTGAAAVSGLSREIAKNKADKFYSQPYKDGNGASPKIRRDSKPDSFIRNLKEDTVVNNAQSNFNLHNHLKSLSHIDNMGSDFNTAERQAKKDAAADYKEHKNSSKKMQDTSRSFFQNAINSNREYERNKGYHSVADDIDNSVFGGFRRRKYTIDDTKADQELKERLKNRVRGQYKKEHDDYINSVNRMRSDHQAWEGAWKDTWNNAWGKQRQQYKGQNSGSNRTTPNNDIFKKFGITPNQFKTKKEFNSWYRQQAKKYHPDINPNGETKFKEINNFADSVRNSNWYEHLAFERMKYFEKVAAYEDDIAREIY